MAPAWDEDGVRAPAVAGQWYPAVADELTRVLVGYLEGVEPWTGDAPRALIVPHAGYVYSGAVAAWGFAALGEHPYARIFVLAPAHRAYLEGAEVADHAAFRTPLGEMPVDRDAGRRLAAATPLFVLGGDSHQREHAVEAEVPFLQHLRPGSTLVPILVGHVDRGQVRKLAAALRDELRPDDLVVVSTDFTHYGQMFGYVPPLQDVEEGLRALDMAAWERVAAGDAGAFLRHRAETGITICGARPLAVLMDLLGEGGTYTLRRYDTSGAMTGDWSHSVSYVAAVATGPRWGAAEDGADGASEPAPDEGGVTPLTAAEQQTLLTLARDSIEAHLAGDPPPALDDYELSGRMRREGGVFVTLRRREQLRGCIGEIVARRPLAENVRQRAVDAATHDPRFPAVARGEIDDLHIEISVLTPLRPVSGPDEIVLGRDGVLLTHGSARSVFLPQVAPEQGWDLDQTLTALARKARLPRDAWRDPEASFEVFQAEVFEEEDPDR